MWQRALLVIAALLLIKPGWITDLIGLAVAAVVIVVQLAAARGAPARSG
jgi:UPF0716 family protein affecting phage T7 exclusion